MFAVALSCRYDQRNPTTKTPSDTLGSGQNDNALSLQESLV
jgi:hypothetical protein